MYNIAETAVVQNISEGKTQKEKQTITHYYRNWHNAHRHPPSSAIASSRWRRPCAPKPPSMRATTNKCTQLYACTTGWEVKARKNKQTKQIRIIIIEIGTMPTGTDTHLHLRSRDLGGGVHARRSRAARTGAAATRALARPLIDVLVYVGLLLLGFRGGSSRGGLTL